MNRTLDPEVFKALAAKGLNCKQIAKAMGYTCNDWGAMMKESLGMYPSVYLSRMKNGR